MSPEQLTGRANSIVEKKFIKDTLQRSAQRIGSRQQTALSNSALRGKNVLRNRKISTPNTTIHIEHLMRQRFTDMKSLGGKPNRKRVQLHNTIIISEYNQIFNELSYGFTEEIKTQISGNLNLEL